MFNLFFPSFLIRLSSSLSHHDQLSSFTITEKDSLDVWVNGKRMETRADFVEDGTEIQFDLSDNGTVAGIRTVSSGNKKEGIMYTLFVDGQKIPESSD